MYLEKTTSVIFNPHLFTLAHNDTHSYHIYMQFKRREVFFFMHKTRTKIHNFRADIGVDGIRRRKSHNFTPPGAQQYFLTDFNIHRYTSSLTFSGCARTLKDISPPVLDAAVRMWPSCCVRRMSLVISPAGHA